MADARRFPRPHAFVNPNRPTGTVGAAERAAAADMMACEESR